MEASQLEASQLPTPCHCPVPAERRQSVTAQQRAAPQTIPARVARAIAPPCTACLMRGRLAGRPPGGPLLPPLWGQGRAKRSYSQHSNSPFHRRRIRVCRVLQSPRAAHEGAWGPRRIGGAAVAGAEADWGAGAGTAPRGCATRLCGAPRRGRAGRGGVWWVAVGGAQHSCTVAVCGSWLMGRARGGGGATSRLAAQSGKLITSEPGWCILEWRGGLQAPRQLG
jgi:hypothetical protein